MIQALMRTFRRGPTQVVMRAGRTELWHTRLGVRRDGHIDEVGDADRRAVRAIDRDQGAPPAAPFETVPSGRQRQDIVRLTSDFTMNSPLVLNGLLIGETPYTLVAVHVNRLMLSSQGGWLDSESSWDMSNELRVQEDILVEEWRHIAAMGRDQFVRIVEAGCAYPFGNRSSHVTEPHNTQPYA
jgi:hypothetical protein